MDAPRQVEVRFALLPAFGDLPPGSPYAGAVRELAARGVVLGFPDGSFQPGAATLRAQMAVLVVRAVGWDGEDWGNYFPDQGAVDAGL